jgi:hypothetical protein
MNLRERPIMERVARVVPRLNVLIGLIGVVAGAIILVTCTSTGLLSKRNGKIAWGSAGLGFLEGLAGFLMVLLFTAFFVGSIYLLVRTSEDVRAIRKALETPADESTAQRERRGT